MKNKERTKKANFSTKDLKYKLRKYYDKRWKKVCLILVLILILNSIIFLFSGKNLVEKGIKRALYTAGIYTEEIREVSVASNDFENDIDGGINIKKEARWTSLNTAEIKITLESKVKEVKGTNKDIVVLLDANKSLAGLKMNDLRESFSNLLDYTLKNEDNRISLISFNDKGVVNSEFTNSKDQFLNAFDNIELSDKRSYRVGLNTLRTFLSDYQETDKELIVLFIIDGYANLDTSNYLLEYIFFKEEHPNSNVKGITYEVGDFSKTGIQEISDSQYYAEYLKIEEKLFEAMVDSLVYENLEITDLIYDEYFYLESEEDISSTSGDVTLTNENGGTKIIWNMDGLQTGGSESLTLKVKIKDERQNEVGYFPTNKKEEATYKIEGDESKKVTSSLTPVLKNGYTLTYDTNSPKGCNIKNVSTEIHNAFSLVTKKDEVLSCPQYTFKGWEIVDDDGIQLVNNDILIMPERDIIIRGTWTKLGIDKSMEGTLYVKKYILDFNKERGYLDNEKSEFVSEDSGINFGNIASDTNGKGLYVRAGTENDEYPIFYYRGNVSNNVLFANHCWKIVRTTEEGGTKLIYNGEPNESGDICDNTSTASQIGKSAFNTEYGDKKYLGYMFDKSSSTIKDQIDKWYEDNIKDTKYESSLEDAIWCNDKSIASVDGAYTMYATYGRQNAPIFTCPNNSDKYTVNNSAGNRLLSYPIALLTADEVIFAGGVYGSSEKNLSYYLFTGEFFWTLTPIENNSSFVFSFRVGTVGELRGNGVEVVSGIRPSIVLKRGIEASSGTGTAKNPYVVVTE